MKVVYSDEQRRLALRVYRRTRSVTKTVRELGFPGRWTLYQWLRDSQPGRRPRKQTKRLRHYDLETKMRAVELYEAGHRVDDIALECGLQSKASVYAWAQKYRLEGRWALMSRKERKVERALPTRKSLEASLPDDPAQLRQLAAQLLLDKAVLESELELIKKDVSVIPGQLSNQHKTMVVDALRSSFPLPALLEAVGLSSSSYYYQRQAMRAPDKYAHLRQPIHRISRDSLHTYGYRRIWLDLKEEGFHVSEKVVRRLMVEESIEVRRATKKWQYSSYQGEVSPAPDNLVQRHFHAPAPNLLWLTDISVFATNKGRLYLSAIIDCFDGMVVGYKTGTHPTMELAEQTLIQALQTHKPRTDGSLVLHSDRGVHYRGRAWLGLTAKHNITRSMSKKGSSPDNAACEGFFGRLKVEMYYGKPWHTPEQLAQALDEYICFYNERRIKLTLGGKSPTQYRQTLAA